MNDKAVVRKNRYFQMYKDVHRTQSGRGSRFQNHKITCYTIVSNTSIWSSAWSPKGAEVTALINSDQVRTSERNKWKFDTKKAADKAWMLLLLKYGG